MGWNSDKTETRWKYRESSSSRTRSSSREQLERMYDQEITKRHLMHGALFVNVKM